MLRKERFIQDNIQKHNRTVNTWIVISGTMLVGVTGYLIGDSGKAFADEMHMFIVCSMLLSFLISGLASQNITLASMHMPVQERYKEHRLDSAFFLKGFVQAIFCIGVFAECIASCFEYERWAYVTMSISAGLTFEVIVFTAVLCCISSSVVGSLSPDTDDDS